MASIITPVPPLIDRSVRVVRTAVQSIPNAVNTAISWQAEDFDTEDMWNIGSPTRITIATLKKYKLLAVANFAANITSFRRAFFQLNGVTVMGITTVDAVGAAGVGTTFAVLDERLLNPGDFIELIVRQDSGVALDFNFGSAFLAAQALN